MAWDSVDDEVGNEDVGYGGIASDFGGTGASGDFGGGFDSSDQGNYGEPDPDVVDKHGNLTQVFQDLIANQALGSSTLSSEYQNYADDLGTEYGLNMDEGMNLDF
ncbi:MAG TPA: hypothetical protein DCS66_05490, partial [Flavobacteriaceae bacterium]|nr:hypothetical protein [Flavobacteriaceae bacterium]